MIQHVDALPELAHSSLDYTVDSFAALLRDAAVHAVPPLRQALGEAGRAAELSETGEARLVIIVDQLEELFTQEQLPQAEREAFVTALEALANSGLVWVVATMRSDFFDRLERLPALAALSAGGGRYLLLPPDEAEIGQIIRRPAREAGLRFETEPARAASLDDVILHATGCASGALPLLSFLLDQLWRRRTPEGTLTFAAYNDLRGLEGAIGRRAEEVFREQPDTVRNELTGLLRALVTVTGGTATSRPTPLAQFPEGSPARALVDAFADPQARLLVVDGAQLRLAHEALLTHWPRARDQVATDARDLELRGRLEEEAKRYGKAGRRDKRGLVLPAGLRLAEGRALCARWGAALPAEVTDFVTASRRATRRKRLRRTAGIAGAVVALPVIAALVWVAVTWWGVWTVEAEMSFIRIPPLGAEPCFQMGSPNTDPQSSPSEGPVHEVCPKPFELGKFEVTQRDWRLVMFPLLNPDPSYFKAVDANGVSWKDAGWLARLLSFFGGRDFKNDKLPVENVSWDDANTFIWWMNFFGRHHGYRLPSEAEWEYAARAGKKTPFYWGERVEDGCDYENIQGCGSRPPPLRRWDRISPTRGGSTTCSATSRNGSRIVT
jgi:hypothetical protein